MRARTNDELDEMIGRMLEADHPIYSIVSSRYTHGTELLIPFVVPDLKPVYETDRVRIHAARAATLTVANVTSYKWQASSRLESDFLEDMLFKTGRSRIDQFALQGTWSRLHATVSAPKVTLCIKDEIQSYWHAFGTPAGDGDCTGYGSMSETVERAREERIELPDWVARMAP